MKRVAFLLAVISGVDAMAITLLAEEGSSSQTSSVGLAENGLPALVDATKTNGIRPMSPSEAVLSLQTTPGFHAELVAAEPLIESPVAIAFGPDGKLWVAEMCDYPQGKSGAGIQESGLDAPRSATGESGVQNLDSTEGGRIKCLYDDDHDGRYDRAEVFLTGLPYPTGVTVWRNGVLICAAPDILFAEDTNGDGKADKVEKLFSGFATHNYQARVNSLEYGLDGWVYGSCGLFGGEITSVKTGEVIALGQRDFRFNPDTGAMEPATGSTQQGRVRNDWDDWFGCDNTTPLKHYPLADHYLRQNSYSTPATTAVKIAAGPDPGRLYSISNQVLFMLSGPPNRPTAACGLGIYRDNLLGDEFYSNAFTCEPVNNLVHRQLLSANGVTFSCRRAEEELDREFLASTDPWFRPVQVRTGPDGALWVVDMYRYVIEHPIWIPPDTLATLDPRAGSNMGRIYRVVADGKSARTPLPINRLHGEQLAAAMESTNGTQRDLVQQQIQWTGDRETIETLKRMAQTSARPEVRIQALSTWANLEAPTADVLQKVLADADPQVRRHAVRISEPQLKSSPQLAAAVINLATDSDAFVRMQVAYSSAFLGPADSARSLASIIANDGRDPYLRSAEESALTTANISLVLSELKKTAADDRATDRLLIFVATLANADAFKSVLSELSSLPSQTTDSTLLSTGHLLRLARFIDAWSRRAPLNIDPSREEIRSEWKPALDRAVTIMEAEDMPLPLRVAAVRLVAHGPFLGEPQARSLAALLTSRTPPELQSAAIDALGRDSSDMIAELILSDWAAREPRQRKDCIALLMSRKVWTQRLLTAIADRTVSARELDLPQQQQLLDHADQGIRTAAALSFKPSTSASRQMVIDRYTAALKNDGDPGKGRQVFQKHCSNCHRVKDLGHVVGPDIVGYSHKPFQSLLIAMLDPNQAVDPRYQSYVIVRTDGRSATGLIAEETTSSLTLLAPEAKRESVLRSEVEEIRSTGKSLMPEGLEQKTTIEDVNDLWAFFKTLHVPSKQLTGNTPTIVEIPTAGNVALLASQAEIYGDEITFEQPFKNIGYWHHRDDIVRWRIVSPAIREVNVWAEWACDLNSAGGAFLIEGGQPVLKSKARSTGGWNRYQLAFIGTLTIRDGESEIVMRPADDLPSALVDLRALHLVSADGVPLATGMVEQSKEGIAPESTQLKSAASIASFLIDDRNSDQDRQQLLEAHLSIAGQVIPLMAAGLPAEGGSEEEYRRIPWIWRVAIAVGKRGDPDQIRSVLAASLPKTGDDLEHWQAVVIGGGLINGMGLVGKWPLEELTAIISDDKDLDSAWQRTLLQSATMADDETVPTGTRYDALRMVAMLDWSKAEPVIIRYLQEGIHDELQMGAISGISDIQNETVANRLIQSYADFSKSNRNLALNALLRTENRCLALLDALAAKMLPPELAQDELIKRLRTHESQEVSNRAIRVLK